MWFASFVQLLALATADFQSATTPSPGAAPASPPVTAAGPAPVYTRQALFAIPFHVDRPDRITNEPVEVQLYVSGDRGGHWDLYRKATPARGHFLFRAGMDGEYRFSVRTLDRSGKLHPEGSHVPGLKVIVDTRPIASRSEMPASPGGGTPFPPADRNPMRPAEQPVAVREAAAFPGPPPPPRPDDARPSGRITACEPGLGSDGDKLTIAWEVSDNTHLAARPITLCASETLGGPWTTIAGDLENTGRYTWTPQNRIAGRLFLRLEIRDQSGNIGTYETPEPVALGGR